MKARTHGGQASQAIRRGESWIQCTDCTTHGRSRLAADPDPDEYPTLWRLLGMVVWLLIMGAIAVYALPVVLIGLAGTVPA